MRLLVFLLLTPLFSFAASPQLSTIGLGWAQNSVNTTIFRKNSIVSDSQFQYAAYYDPDGFLTLARRPLHANDWTVRKTEYKGNVHDAHNSISIALDGNGFLHVAWDHHNNPLRYARSIAPGSLELGTPIPQIGRNESDVTYPEFYPIADGDLLFLYRDGESGRGNLVINRYLHESNSWIRIQDKLIDGENQRNAYWQVYADPFSETIHLSWVWRETWDVSTNHDLSYAVSHDGGQTWSHSDNSTYQLPITIANAEVAWHIPQNSELINQTAMFADSAGRPYIATYWTPENSDIPQYHLVFHDGKHWNASQVSQRETPFSLSGGGTKRIPISRPQLLAKTENNLTAAYLIFRDAERGNRPSIASCPNLANPTWQISDLADLDLGQWEPSYDSQLWAREYRLNLFLQRTEQGDGETSANLPPQPVSILDWTP